MAASAAPSRYDWTAVYRMCEDVCESEGVSTTRAGTAAAPPPGGIPDGSGIPGCSHDHTSELRIYEMPTASKLACCSVYRREGNMYVCEGQWARAMERYRRALVYYEYAFGHEDADEGPSNAEASPDGSSASGNAGEYVYSASERALERVRLVCLLNMCVCTLRMESWKDTVMYATQALEIDPACVKALYRRAVARRMMHDYDAAEADIRAATRILTHTLAQTQTLTQTRASAEARAGEAEDNQSGGGRPADAALGTTATPGQSNRMALEIDANALLPAVQSEARVLAHVRAGYERRSRAMARAMLGVGPKSSKSAEHDAGRSSGFTSVEAPKEPATADAASIPALADGQSTRRLLSDDDNNDDEMAGMPEAAFAIDTS